MQFSDQHITIATTADVNSIVQLLNSAYRGESSKKGWTTEAHLIGGEVRTSGQSVLEAIGKPGTVMLKYTGSEGAIIGCVNLQTHGDRIYLGMFSVSPDLQGRGIGKKLLNAAEEYAKQQAARSIYMRVISVRSELIDWYKRYGYSDTGEKESFEEDGLTGNHLQVLQFIILEKML